MSRFLCRLSLLLISFMMSPATASDIKQTDLYRRIRAAVDAVPAIDTHDHLRPFDQMPFRDKTDKGEGLTLRGVWQGSYYPWLHPVGNWPDGAPFETWWQSSKHNFDNARATSFYRYVLPAFQNLYGVDFETMTDEQA